MSLERVDLVVIDRRAGADAAVDIQPSERLHAGEDEDVVVRVELLTLPRFLAARELDVDVALARERGANAGVEDIFVAALDAIPAVVREEERGDALDPEALTAARI